MSKVKNILFILMLSFVFQSNAGLITYGTFSRDDTTKIVNGNDLEWLQWNYTVDNTMQQALDKANNNLGGGWEVADNKDMSGLFNYWFSGFASPGLSWDNDSTTKQISTCSYSSCSNAMYFKSLFGVTDSFNGRYTKALFGGGNLFNYARVQSRYSFNRWAMINYKKQTMELSSNTESDRASKYTGWALVRRAQTTNKVPEPTTLALFSLCVFCLYIRSKVIQ